MREQEPSTYRPFVFTVVEDDGVNVTIMPNHNKGFDIDCQSPNGYTFRVEVKTSSSKNTHIPIQLHHVEGNLKPDLFFVLVKKSELAPLFRILRFDQIGRASCRERV